LQENKRALKPYTRKRVREPPNDKFARIKDIIKAQEASMKPPKRRRITRRMELEPMVEEAQEMIIHGLNRLRRAQEME